MSPDGGSPQAGVAETLERAIALHRGGDLAGAEALYRAIVEREAGHADAHYHLGVLLMATERAAAALPHLQAALQANPSEGQYWIGCIDALIRVAQVDAARRMLEVAGEHGLRGDAVEALRQRLQEAGNSGAAGEAARQAGGAPAPATASQAAKAPAKRRAGHFEPTEKERARLQRLFAQENDEELEAAARRWSERYPESGFAWNLLGAARQRRRQFSEAEAFYRRALDAEPELAEACFNLGRMLQLRGAGIEAERLFRRAIERPGDFLEAHFSLGEVLSAMRRFAEAEASYRRVLKLRPELAVAHNNLSIVLRRLDRPGEAEESARQAVAFDPQLAAARSSLGAALQDGGRLGEAAAAYREAIALDPELAAAWHGLLFCLSHGGETDPAALFAEHLRFADRFEAPLRARWPRHGNVRDPERVLQVGFVSGDFRQHAMANFIEPMLAALGKVEGVELHAYSNHAFEDAVTERIRGSVRHWNRVFALSDEALAEKIQADGIDILVDLTGHTANNRLLTFARKPAPVQCGWIGYLGTSGMQSMDYYLADRYYLPPGEFDGFFTEKIVYLEAVAAFRPSEGWGDVGPLPALANGYVTFGSFSRVSKLSREVIALWSRLLRELPEARMLLAGMPSDGRDGVVRGWFEDEGIAAGRLEFYPRCDTAQYFALHHRVDLCLDPFPFTGATTTGNALWMGVPTLTLAGKTVPGRLGAALLCHAGLEDFVARSPEEFVEKGMAWARDLENLAALRAGLRARVLASAISQPELVARSLTEKLREMWRTWCARRE